MATGSIKKVSNDSSTNYCKMPDGTLIQWGVKSVNSSNGVNVTFPIAFITSSGMNIQATLYTGYPDNERTCATSNWSTTGCKLSVYLNGASTLDCAWLAIGRWK